MITESEIELFKCELLKRPLVLQPVSHVGVGCNRGGMSCGMCYKDGKYNTSVATSPDDSIAKSLVDGLVGTGFASLVPNPTQSGFLRAQWVDVRPLHPPL